MQLGCVGICGGINEIQDCVGVCREINEMQSLSVGICGGKMRCSLCRCMWRDK